MIRKLTVRSFGIVIIVAVAVAGNPSVAEAQYMGKGAGIGALLGLALGDGNVLEDVAAGAALGAAGGGIANMATGGKNTKRKQREAEYRAREEARRRAEYDAYMAQRDREMAEREQRYREMEASKRERDLMEREARLAEQERLRAKSARSIQDVVDERDDAERAIIQAIGPDAWEGYKALRGCNPDRARALAGVAATSSVHNHQLAALWLEAMVAVDSKDTARAHQAFNTIVQHDSDIDTVQQASMATDSAVLDMRAERRDIGIHCR